MSSKTKTANDHVIERDGYAEVTLTRPRQVNGVETAVLRMREPTVEDMERFQDDKGSDAQREVRMIANLCEIPPDDLRKLPLRDYARLQSGVALYHLTLPQIRQGVLALAGHTGWALREIMTLRVSKFIWWIQGLPVHGE